MKWLKSIAAYGAVAYLSLVGANALFFAYTGFRYTSRPGWEAATEREQRDAAKKRAFLKAHPEYSGLLSAAAPGVVTQLARKHAFLPLGHGLPNTPLIYCNEGYGFLKYTTDRYGFHNDDAVWDQQHPWLLIGDSFTQGACVPTEHNIASRLMQTSGDPVINLGNADTGPDRYTALARVFIGLTRPRQVVLIFYENDFNAADGSIYVDHPELYSAYGNGTFRASSQAFYKAMRDYIDGEKSRFIAGEKSWSRRIRKTRDKVIDGVERVLALRDIRTVLMQNVETFNYVRLAVETAANECGNFKPGCELIVVYIPPSQYFRLRPQRFIEAQADYLRSVVAQMKGRIAFIDLTGALDRKSYAPEGPHLSIEGYKFVANKILEQSRRH